MNRRQGGTGSSSSSAAAARRRAEQEAARRRAQQEAARRQAEARRKAEQEAARRRAQQEAARKKAEQERLAEQRRREQQERYNREQAKLREKANAEAARRKAEQEAARKRAQQEAERKRQREKQLQLAEQKRKQEEAAYQAKQAAAKKAQQSQNTGSGYHSSGFSSSSKAGGTVPYVPNNPTMNGGYSKETRNPTVSTPSHKYELDASKDIKETTSGYVPNNPTMNGGYSASTRNPNVSTPEYSTWSGKYTSDSEKGNASGTGGYDSGGSGYGSGSYSDGGYSDYGTGETMPENQPDLEAILEAYKQMIQQQAYAAMQSANSQIDSDLASALANYDRQRGSAQADYQKAIDNSELNRFWAGKELREQQANNGLLNAGSSRQDKLYLDNTYQNNLTKILNERATTYADIARAMQDAQNKANIAKAQNQQNYINSQAEGMTSILPTLLSGYTGNSSDLLSKFYTTPTAPMATTQNAAAATTPSLTDYLKAYQDGDSSYWKKKNNQKYTY